VEVGESGSGLRSGVVGICPEGKLDGVRGMRTRAEVPDHIAAHIHPLPDPTASFRLTASQHNHVRAIGVGVGLGGSGRCPVIPDIVERRVGQVLAPEHTGKRQLCAHAQADRRGWKAKAHIHPRCIVIAFASAHVGLPQGGIHPPAPAENRGEVQIHCDRSGQKRHAGIGNNLDGVYAVPAHEAEGIGTRRALSGAEHDLAPDFALAVEATDPLGG